MPTTQEQKNTQISSLWTEENPIHSALPGGVINRNNMR